MRISKRISKKFTFFATMLVAGFLYVRTKVPMVPESVAQWQLPHGELRLDQTHFVGAHNALISRFSNTRWGTFLYAQQTWNLKDQLRYGVRVFELDIGGNYNKICACHRKCTGPYALQKIGSYEPFAEIMQTFAAWLEKHPQEILILLLDSIRDQAITQHMIDAELDALPDVTKHILSRTVWNPDEHNGNWPKLGWLRSNNKRLIIFNDRLDDSCKYTFHHWSYVMCTPPHVGDHEKSTQLRPESLTHNKPHAQLYQLNHFAGFADSRIAWLCAIGSTLMGKLENNFRKYRALDNNVDHIASIIDHGKKKRVAKGKNPNFIMLDNVDRFICNNGIALINEWNAQETLGAL
jgi:hypothetical protein